MEREQEREIEREREREKKIEREKITNFRSPQLRPPVPPTVEIRTELKQHIHIKGVSKLSQNR